MRYPFILLLFLVACNIGEQKKPDPTVGAANDSVDSTKNSFTLVAVGDMMLGTDYPNKTRFTEKNILLTLADTLRNADFTIGNLEGVLANDTLTSKKCEGKNNCYAFRSPVSFAGYFKNAGFDFLSIANNHSGDFEEEGLRQTMRALDGAGIKYAGLKGICEYAILKNNGIKLGMIGVGHAWRHVYINDYQHITNLIKKVKKEADVVAVFYHGGAEGDTVEHVPRRQEIFFTEKRGNVYELAHKCVDAGADLVIGSGPHVTRPMELYKNKLIAYSLGNFATYGKVSLRGPMGVAPLLKLNISKSGDFLNGRIISTIQKPFNPTTPMIDTAKRVIKRLIMLNQKDFPDNILHLSNDGILTIKNF